MSAIDYSSLALALGQLEKSLRYSSSPMAEDPELFFLFRTASVQTFEFSFELSHKMLRRRLEADSAGEGVSLLGYPGLIRLGAERGYIADPKAWFDFRDLRNKTSHTYDGGVASEVYQGLPSFLSAAQALLAALQASPQ